MGCPVRNQVEFQECSLDEPLAEGHQAPTVWDYVCAGAASVSRQQAARARSAKERAERIRSALEQLR